MFSSFSWLAFVEFILTVLFFYYVTVLVVFYKLEMSELLTKFTSLKKEKQLVENNATVVVANENKKVNDPVSLTSQTPHEDKDKITISDIDISNIYIELEEAIVIAKQKKYARQELLTSLQLIVRKCTNSLGTPLSKTINSQIETFLGSNSLEGLTSQELSQLWSK